MPISAVRRRASIVVVLTCSFLVTACGAATPDVSEPDPLATQAPIEDVLTGLPSDFAMRGLTTTYDEVTLADDAAIVDRAAVRHGLQAIDPDDDGATLRFSGDTDSVRALRPGQVVAFESVGIGRIVSIQEEAGQLVVKATGAFTFEIESTSEGSSGEETRRTYGVVRPTDEAATVNFEIEGTVSTHVTIGTRSWVDYGDSQWRPLDEPDLSGDAIRELFDEYFSGSVDDFVIAGHETVHGRATIHAVIDPGRVEDQVQAFGDEYEGWSIDLWLAEADGHLVRAVYGGPLAPISFSVPRFTIDVESIDCVCPVSEPS